MDGVQTICIAATETNRSANAGRPLYHYCIIRRDLPLGVIAAQLIHAAGESSPGNLPGDTRAVALAVSDEAELLAIEARLQAAGIPHNSIREPDSPWNGALMAVGIVPMDRTFLRKLLGGLPLLK